MKKLDVRPPKRTRNSPLVSPQVAIGEMSRLLPFLAVIVTGQISSKGVINLAVFLPQTGSWPVGNTIGPAAQLAVDYINNNDMILNDYVIKISYYDTGCNQGKTVWQLIRHTKTNKRMDAIIGGGCDPVCEILGLFAAHRFLPMVSWGCQSAKFSNKRKVMRL